MRRLRTTDKSGAGETSAVLMEEQGTKAVGGRSMRKITAAVSAVSLPPCIGRSGALDENLSIANFSKQFNNPIKQNGSSEQDAGILYLGRFGNYEGAQHDPGRSQTRSLWLELANKQLSPEALELFGDMGGSATMRPVPDLISPWTDTLPPLQTEQL
ncbi:Proprotein Convertase Subtilisin/Kexin Type 6 [Manis pentadactyla]|nr:Proprotein Convertase Subtilisin/Kexin Type 6 [Manis pentadactyla]